jgi:ribosomal protein S6
MFGRKKQPTRVSLMSEQAVAQSKDEVIRQLEGQLETERAAHRATQMKLRGLHYETNRMKARIYWLLGDAIPDETIDEIEEAIEGRPE